MKGLIKKICPAISHYRFKHVHSICIYGGIVIIRITTGMPWIKKDVKTELLDEKKYGMARILKKQGYITEKEYEKSDMFVVSVPGQFIAIIHKSN